MSSVVYFVHDGEATKIGYTAVSPESRMRSFQTGRPLSLLGTIPGGREVEKRLHGLFSHRRVKGEWFEGLITPEDGQQALRDQAEREAMREGAKREREAEQLRALHLRNWLGERLPGFGADYVTPEEWNDEERLMPFLRAMWVQTLHLIEHCDAAGIDPRTALAATRPS
jgi:hypothetical protein